MKSARFYAGPRKSEKRGLGNLLKKTQKKHPKGAKSEFLSEKIPAMGIEPILPKKRDFESRVSTNSTTPAFVACERKVNCLKFSNLSSRCVKQMKKNERVGDR